MEKLLKAVLQESSVPVPRTHDLAALLASVAELTSALDPLEADLICLSSFAVEYRYPGYDAIEADGRQAISAMDEVRSRVYRYFRAA